MGGRSFPLSAGGLETIFSRSKSVYKKQADYFVNLVDFETRFYMYPALYSIQCMYLYIIIHNNNSN